MIIPKIKGRHSVLQCSRYQALPSAPSSPYNLGWALCSGIAVSQEHGAQLISAGLVRLSNSKAAKESTVRPEGVRQLFQDSLGLSLEGHLQNEADSQEHNWNILSTSALLNPPVLFKWNI